MIALALTLWRIPAVRGVAASVAFLAAVVGWGVLRHHDGYSDGYREGKQATEAAWNADAALARTSAEKATMRADSTTSALRDSLDRSSIRIARLSEAAALARGQYREALLQYNLAKVHARDSLPATDVIAACDVLANRCAIAIATAQDERDALSEKLRLAEALAVEQTKTITTEPARWKPVVSDALAQQRQSFRAPSRTAWTVAGGIAGSLLTLLVR